MKKIASIITVLFLLLITSCSTPQNEQLVKEYTTFIGQEPKVSNNIYDWKNLSEQQVAQLEIKLKEAADKILGFIPTETHKLEISASTGDLYSSYTWENANIKVNLYIDYQKGSESIQLVFRQK